MLIKYGRHGVMSDGEEYQSIRLLGEYPPRQKCNRSGSFLVYARPKKVYLHGERPEGELGDM
jgi:hypothetical protein